jgi:putative methyltransferase (TIGR04325 family)
MSESSTGFYLRARLAQIRFTASLLDYLGQKQGFARLFRALRKNFLFGPILQFLLGFRRTFSTFKEAEQAAKRYIPSGHEHRDNILMHSRLVERARESDYPVFYYWSKLENPPRRILDLGGNMGNIFYTYQNYLQFPEDTEWSILDLQEVRAAGERVAADKSESRIRYVDSIESSGEIDLFLSSGSLHYFDEPLAGLLGRLPGLPRYVIINRVPVCEGQQIYTVQDSRSFLIPCKIRNRTQLVAEMQELGYELEAFWDAHQLSLRVPLYPDSSAHTYSGFLFRHKKSATI